MSAIDVTVRTGDAHAIGFARETVNVAEPLVKRMDSRQAFKIVVCF
jgi:hypothetical protein